jgi:NADPH-dependent 2,4-dienoyl-CoA reductase/sulfur reductase-like enzyme
VNAPDSVLVVGASAAGLSTAEALRRKGYQGRLTLLDAENYLPYDRPPLSKQVLSGAWDPDRAQLRAPEALVALDAEFVLADPAAGLDVATRTVHTSTGRALQADAVVVATGLRARTLPGQEGLAGVHVLRTLDDSVALRADLAPTPPSRPASPPPTSSAPTSPTPPCPTSGPTSSTPSCRSTACSPPTPT